MFSYWAKAQDALDLARYLNDDIAKTVAEHPTRFVGLGTLPMQDPQLAIVELRRCVLELGMKGVQIGTHINDWNLDAPELDPFWQEAEKLDVGVFVHPWDMQTKGRWEKYWFPWLIGMPCETTMAICSLVFGGVLEKYPRLRVAFAHGGGSFFGTLGRIVHGWEARPDLCAVNCKQNPLVYLERIWVDSLVHDEATLRFVVEKMGGFDRILLGTDYPFPLGELEPGKIIDGCEWLTEEAKAAMLGGNCQRFLNLS
jgi:aminocarboxymuconate-semialdehyde decarboxylase